MREQQNYGERQGTNPLGRSAVKQQNIGSNYDDFLKQEGLLAECEAGALKRVVAWQLEQVMKRRRISRANLASRMKTRPETLDRLFAPDESSVTLQLLEQAALALGRKLKIELA
jgi:hypothetical protein